MGKLIYGPAGSEVDIDDRALAHLKVVMLSKLRRGEGFAFSWSHGAEGGGGQTTVWLHPVQHVEFKFLGGRQVALNREWIDALLMSANSAGGLLLLPEPGVAAAR